MKTIFFDWDGTLVKKEVAEEASIRRGKTLGIKFSRKYMQEAQKTHAHYIDNLDAIEKYTGIKDKRIKTEIMTNLFQLHYLAVVNEQKENIFYKDILKVLKEIKKDNVTYVIISTIREDIIKPALELVKLNHLFEGVFGNTPDLKYSKKDLVDKAVSKFGKPYLVVGDREDDLIAGKDVGAETAYAQWGHGFDKNKELADYVLEKPTNLIRLIKK